MAEKNRERDQCLMILYEMEEMLDTAKGNIIPGDIRFVNTKELRSKLERLRAALPVSIEKADRVLMEQENMKASIQAEREQMIVKARQEADGERTRAKNDVMAAQKQLADLQNRLSTAPADAERKAQQTLADAQNQYNNMLAQAQRQADAMLQNAHRQCEDMLQRAQQEAEYMKTQEQVYMRAQVDADRIKAEAQEEAQKLHDNSFRYVDSFLAHMEQYMGDILTDIHQERDSLQSRQ